MFPVDPSLSKAGSVSWLTADLDTRVCRTTGLLLTDSLTGSKVKVTKSFLRMSLGYRKDNDCPPDASSAEISSKAVQRMFDSLTTKFEGTVTM